MAGIYALDNVFAWRHMLCNHGATQRVQNSMALVPVEAVDRECMCHYGI